jgi:hypothetical protein
MPYLLIYSRLLPGLGVGFQIVVVLFSIIKLNFIQQSLLFGLIFTRCGLVANKIVFEELIIQQLHSGFISQILKAVKRAITKLLLL